MVTEEYALRALRTQVAPSWIPPLAEFTIAAVLAMLVMGPALAFFFRAHAEVYARVRVLKPVSGFNGLKGWGSRLKLARAIRSTRKAIAESRKMFDEMADRLNGQKGLLAAAEKAGLEDLDDLRTEIEAMGVRQREGREELEGLVTQRAMYLEGYQLKQSELGSIYKALSKMERETTIERLLPGPNSTARLARISAEMNQISETLTSEADSANEVPEHPTESNDA